MRDAMDRSADGVASARHGRLARLTVIATAATLLLATLVVATLTVTLPPPDPRRIPLAAKYVSQLPGGTPAPLRLERSNDTAADLAPLPIQRTPTASAEPRSAPHTAEPSPRDDQDPTAASALEVDDAGHFRPTPGAIQLFRSIYDDFGDWRRDQARQAIDATITRSLPEPAAGEAHELLDKYLRYLDALRALPPAGRDVHSLAERLAQTREIERSIFGDALAATLFDPEHDPGARALERLIERADPTRSALPTDAHPTAPHTSTRLGAEPPRPGAASTWDARFAAYRIERDAILADRSLDPAQRVEALDRLRERHFTGEDYRRAADLDRLDALFPRATER